MSVCGYGRHCSFASRGSGAHVLLAETKKSLLLVPNASVAPKCCSDHHVAVRSGSLENSDTSSEVSGEKCAIHPSYFQVHVNGTWLDDHCHDVRSGSLDNSDPFPVFMDN